ncbi:peroxidase 16-like [Triticum dicoccoides]|uniref:peroxidase 16-like n=1 Tax=Triticum dicoccoides TaxID=85692 RepID=UPI000E7C5DF2|nr:peroxidase 16-like [Triticum dicoccoides]
MAMRSRGLQLRSRRESLLVVVVVVVGVLLLLATAAPRVAAAGLSRNYYAKTCPNVEALVRGAVTQKLQETFNAAPGTLRLFFHDCFVRGCDASVLISGPGDEHSAGADTTLSPDALDLITRAKAAVDADAGCSNKVSCADILALATRDVVQQAGGPSYPVELGRLDGKVGTRAVVKHSLPGAGFSLDQLNKLFAANGLTQTDMIALSGGHTIGVTHCDKFVRRLYTFKGARPQYSPPMNLAFLRQMRGTCPLNYSPATVAMLDAVTPNRFDNGYYQTLQQQKGLLSSDQVLFADRRSRATVNHFASNQTAFFDAFVAAMAKLGRIGVKTAGSDAEIRRVCTKVN